MILNRIYITGQRVSFFGQGSLVIGVGPAKFRRAFAKVN